jgi:hypothetical protein
MDKPVVKSKWAKMKVPVFIGAGILLLAISYGFVMSDSKVH